MVKAASEITDGRAVFARADYMLLGAFLKWRCSKKDDPLVGTVLSY